MSDVTPSAPDQPHGHGLGLAGWTAKTFIHSPLSPLLFFAMLGMGLLGLMATPRQEDPQISVPMIDVFVQFPGASTEQVGSLAVEPLERLLSELPGVKHVYSASEQGQGIITVQFEVGEQMGPSIVKVHDKLQANPHVLPPGALTPLVRPKGIDDVPAVTLTLWSDVIDDAALRALGAKLLQSLSQIPDVGQGFLVGGRAEQIRVEVEPQRLAGFGVTLEQIAGTIQTANAERRTGSVESNERDLTVYAGAFLQNASDVEGLMIGSHQGAPVYVRDVARVALLPEEYHQQVSYFTGPAYPGEAQADGMPAVTVALAKKEGSNGVTVANAILEKAERLKGQLIPDNVRLEVTRNYGATANDKVNELIFKLFVATGAVTVLVLLALGIKPAIVVTLVIPVVLLMTVFSAWIMGYTIDRVSLFALIFSIGILVDDAIVVVENIYRRWLMKGDTDTDTAVAAVAEVGNPTIIATFTVVAALLPMGFVSGLMGPYMEPIPALGSAAMLFSLFAAFAFTPWLAMRIKPSLAALKRAGDKEHRDTEHKLDGLFRRLLLPLIEHKSLGYMFLFGLIGAFFLSVSLFYFKGVAFKMLPFDNKPEFSVVLDMPEGTALGRTVNTARLLAETLRELPEVVAIQTYAGTAKPFDFNGMVRHYYLRQRPWQGEIQVQLTDKHARDRTSHEIALQARELLTPLARDAGARITVVEMPPGPPVLQAVVAEIYGPDGDTRRQVAADMTALFEQVDSLADVDNYMQQPHSLLRFEVDTEKAVRLGISVDTVIRNLDMALGGFKAGDVKRGSLLEPTYVALEVPLAVRANLSRLADLPIPAAGGGTVPLAEVGRFVEAPADHIVYHKDLRPVEYVVGRRGRQARRAAVPDARNGDAARGLRDARRTDNLWHLLHRRPAGQREERLRVGRGVDGHLRDLPGHGAGLRRRPGADLHAGGGRVRQLRHPGRDHGPHPADPARDRSGPLDHGGGLHRDLHDRLHRPGRHHRAQLHPAGRLLDPGGRRGPHGHRGRDQCLQGTHPPDPHHRPGAGGRLERDPHRSHLPGHGDLAAVRGAGLDPADPGRDSPGLRERGAVSGATLSAAAGRARPTPSHGDGVGIPTITLSFTRGSSAGVSYLLRAAKLVVSPIPRGSGYAQCRHRDPHRRASRRRFRPPAGGIHGVGTRGAECLHARAGTAPDARRFRSGAGAPQQHCPFRAQSRFPCRDDRFLTPVAPPSLMGWGEACLRARMRSAPRGRRLKSSRAVPAPAIGVLNHPA